MQTVKCDWCGRVWPALEYAVLDWRAFNVWAQPSSAQVREVLCGVCMVDAADALERAKKQTRAPAAEDEGELGILQRKGA